MSTKEVNHPLKSWHWRSLSLDNRTASEVFAALFINESIATLLESPTVVDLEQPHLSHYSLCAGSPRTVNGQRQLWTPTIGEILPFLRSLLQQFIVNRPQVAHLPYWWLAWLAWL